jgi:NTP pyrophosphatase (non-canonical NTP hydrolase)
LTLTITEVQEVIDKMEKESKALKKELFELAWYMRGGLSITESYMLDVQDREIMSSIVKEHMEITEKTKLPFF